MKVWHVKRYGNQSYLVRANNVEDALSVVMKEYDLTIMDIYKIEQEVYHSSHDELDLPAGAEVSG